ncbi:MAG: DNA recombination/repair protein RecA, partial [bacterium]|nr:DNA recombination/repair protein RecA [bacterium]
MAKEKIAENRTLDVQNQKLAALEAARQQIDKEFGKGSLRRLGDNPVAANIEVIRSCSSLLVEALVVGGFPRGRTIQFYVPEGSG